MTAERSRNKTSLFSIYELKSDETDGESELFKNAYAPVEVSAPDRILPRKKDDSAITASNRAPSPSRSRIWRLPQPCIQSTLV